MAMFNCYKIIATIVHIYICRHPEVEYGIVKDLLMLVMVCSNVHVLSTPRMTLLVAFNQVSH